MQDKAPPRIQGSAATPPGSVCTVTATAGGRVNAPTVDTTDGTPTMGPDDAVVRSWTAVSCCGCTRYWSGGTVAAEGLFTVSSPMHVSCFLFI